MVEAGTVSREAVDAAREELDAETAAAMLDVHADDEDESFGLQGTLDGGWEELVGGKKPTSVKVRLLGGAIEITPPADGFRKGSRYVVRVETECASVSFTDERDAKTGQVVGSSKGHGLRIRAAALIEDES